MSVLCQNLGLCLLFYNMCPIFSENKEEKHLNFCALALVSISVFPFCGMVVESKALSSLGKHHTPELDPSALSLLYFGHSLIKLLM